MLSAFGGALALAHQLLWTRRMVDLLGGSAGASARVFGCFFLGLALGSLLGAGLAARTRRPWRWIAAAEVAVGLCCLPLVFLPFWADSIWPWLGPENLAAWPGALIKTLLSLALVLPPALMMGLFLPLAVVGWPRADRDPGLLLYAINTLGAVLGLGVVSLWMIQRFGMMPSLMMAVACNGAAAVVSLTLDRKLEKQSRPSPPGQAFRLSMPPKAFLMLSAWSGFLILGAEVAGLQLLQLVAPLSFFAPAAMLGTVIFLLAIASFAVHFAQKRWRPTQGGLAVCALIGGLLFLCAPLFFHWLAPVMPLAVETERGLAGFMGRLVLFALLTLGPAFLIGGLVFPLITLLSAPVGADEPEDADTKLRWGWLLAANGFGAWLGAESMYQVLLPAFGPCTALGLLGMVYLAGAWIYMSRNPLGSMAVATSALVGAVLLLWVLPALPLINRVFLPALVHQTHGREGSVAVLEGEPFGRAILVSNQYFLGSSSAAIIHQRMGHLPLLFHPKPEHTAFIGVATGATPGAAIQHRAVKSIEAAEIAENVAAAAEHWFGKSNNEIMQNPKARVVIEDGRTWIAASNERYDVIVGDLFLPWGPGEGRLYSLEHFRAVRKALKDDGLFCQWLPMYQLTQDQFMVILHTFLEVFPEAYLIRRELDAQNPALGILGWKSGQLDWEVLADRLSEENFALGDEMFTDAKNVRSLYLGRATRGLTSAPVNTLGNLYIELDAGRLQATQPDTALYLEGERWMQWSRDLQQQLQLQIDDSQ